MNVKGYIDSGILEAYVLGIASEAEVEELLHIKQRYPEVQEALTSLEIDMETMAMKMAITPPPNLWKRIEKEVSDIIPAPQARVVKHGGGFNGQQYNNTSSQPDGQQFIEVEGSSSHMRIHKSWKWVFAAVFVLGKIFLAFAIYFYLENRQAREEIRQLKTEMKIRN